MGGERAGVEGEVEEGARGARAQGEAGGQLSDSDRLSSLFPFREAIIPAPLSSCIITGIQYAHLRRPQREQRKQELLQKEKEAAELKKLEEAEAARKAAEQAAALLLQSSAHVALSMDAMPAPVPVPENEQVAQVVEAEADKENTTADAPAEDDASTDSEDERGDDQVASAPDARTVWVSVGQDAST